MSWVKLDDQFFRHPKARAAGKDGRSLFLAGLCWVAGNLTDGFIAAHDITIIAAEADVKPTVSRRLVEVGLWDEADGGWMVHDYLERNPTAEEARARKKQRAEAGRIGGRRSGEARRQANSEAKPEANASANGKQTGKPNRTPSPSPSSSSPSSTNGCLGPAEDDDEKFGQVLNEFVRLKLDKVQVRSSRSGLERTVRANAVLEQGQTLRGLLDEFPTAPVTMLAAALLGEKSPHLAHHRRAG